MTAFAQELELLTRQINQSHRAAMLAALSAVNLEKVGHPMLLSILESSCCADGESQCMAQRDLAQLLHVSPAAVANSLKSLEKGGYIRRRPGHQDARCNHVLLTEKGAAAVQDCKQIYAQVTGRMLNGFSQEEQEQLLSFYRRMLQNLTKKED